MAARQRRFPPARAGRIALILLANAAAAVLLWRLLIAAPGTGAAAPIASGIASNAERAPAPVHEETRGRRSPLERDLRAVVERWKETAHAKGKVKQEDVEIAVHVRERESGAEFGFDDDRALRPASNMKLVTTAAALVLLGADWSFETPIEAVGAIEGRELTGELVVRAGGDPLYDPAGEGSIQQLLAPAIEAVHASGVESVSGDLVLDEDSFAAPAPAPGWPGDSQRWTEYCALAGGFSANRGCLTIRVTPGEVGEPARVSVQPSEHGLTPRFDVKTAASGKLNVAFEVRGGELIVRGVIPRSSAPWSDSCAHPDPVELFGHELRAELEHSGITISGATVRRRGALGGRTIATIRTPLAEVLEPINTHSMNSIADQLFLATARAVEGSATREAGARATRRALASLNVSTDGLVQVDGSGLSKDSRVSARQIAALIEAVLRRDERTAEMYRKSLAVAGEKGTLDDRMKTSPARGRVQAKTGFIAGTSALSGIAHALDGREYVFSILVNYPDVDGLNTSCWKPMQNELCELLVRSAP